MLRRLLFALPAGLFVVVAGYFFWGLIADRNPQAVPSALVDRPVPEFALPAVEGLDRPGLATADLGAGEVTLVNFFASWCIPCRYEHPFLVELSETGQVAVHGINYRDESADARRWLGQLGNPYGRVGRDGQGRTAIDWGVSGVPETFVIGPDGKILYQHIGPLLESDMERKILPLIEAHSQ